jgi:hypothetical protein
MRRRDVRVGQQIRIISVALDAHDGAIVWFYDGTVAGYVVEELLELQPYRDAVIPELMPKQLAG